MEKVMEKQIGLVPPDVGLSTTGEEFLTRLMYGRYPSPPFAQTTDICPRS